MKEVTITLSLLVDDNYSQKDIDEIRDDLEEIISMNDSGDIRYECGKAEFD